MTLNQIWHNKTVLVTGASSGIGAAVARKLAQQGLRVILAARRIDLLEQLAAEICSSGGDAVIFPVDLSQESERLRLYDTITANYGTLDILINNAGFGWYGWYTDMKWETIREMIRVNIEAVVHLTRLFLPGMKTQNSGSIVNVGSVAGAIPSQGIAVYSGTKTFLDAFTTSLHRELRRTNVHISVIRPGPVKSEFFDAAQAHSNGGRVPSERFAISAEAVAGRIWRLIQHPRRMVFIPKWLGIVPWVEQSFGWLMDILGPLLLERTRLPGTKAQRS